MEFAQFLKNYEEKRINEGELVHIIGSNYFTVGNLEKISDETPDNPLEAYNAVYINNPVNLELRPSAGKRMPGICFTEDYVGELSNRENWFSYFVADENKTLSDIFEERVNYLRQFNSNLGEDVTNHFKTIIGYMETTDTITDDAILKILNERPEMYHK